MSQDNLGHIINNSSAPAARPAHHAAGAKPKTSQRWGISAAEFYAALKEQPVQVALGDGKVIVGVLIGVDTYDLMLRTKDNRQVLVAKHAAKYVMPAKGIMDVAV